MVLGEPSRNSFVFSLMCYNVLCDKYCTRQIYGYSPSWCLRWEHRQRLILEEIIQYDADIICLQVKQLTSLFNDDKFWKNERDFFNNFIIYAVCLFEPP